MRRAPSALALALAVAAPLAFSCRKGGEALVFPGAPVVLISIDTLRSDHLPAYGYDGVQTPAIDALREDGILFERAYSQYPLTLPSHASILTGQLPTHHGVRDNLGYDLDTTAHPYLPRLLRSAGYATGGVVSAYVLRGDSGMAQGFDLYDGVEAVAGTPELGNQRAGTETLAVAQRWLAGIDTAKPFFLFFHLYEPHGPYRPPEPFASRYANRYDGEVAASDAVVGQLLDRLRETGVYDRALIVLLSDHGEGLGDHGEQEHGVLLYREALQVPLLVKLPGSRLAGQRVSAVARLIDVAPTILALVRTEAPAPVDGRSLMELLGAGAPPRDAYAETFYPRLHMGWSELESLIAGDHHYIRGPRPELFDLARDPGERHDVSAADRRVLAGLRTALEPLRVPLRGPAAVDAETRQRLAALGYASGVVKTGDGPLPDPRSRIDALRQLAAAERAIAAGRPADALGTLQELVRLNPGMRDAWTELGRVLRELGRLDEAAVVYRRAMELVGPQTDALEPMVLVSVQRGRFDEAAAHARLALAADAAWTHRQLAAIALAREDLATARQEVRLALSARGDDLLSLMLQARIQLLAGEVAGAKQTLGQLAAALAKRPGAAAPPGLDELRAEVATRGGTPGSQVAGAGAGGATPAMDTAAVAARAAALRAQGQPEAAIELLRRALADAAHPVLQRQLGLALVEAGRPGRAIAALEPLAAPGDGEVLGALALAFYALGRLDQAAAAAQQALQGEPRHARALEVLGEVALARGQAGEGRRLLEQAVAIDARLPGAWNSLGVARQYAGDTPGALAAWQRAVALDPGMLDALYNLGLTAAAAGREDVARDALRRYLAAAPADRFAAEIQKARSLLASLETG